LGDFSYTRTPEERSNANFNHREAEAFNSVIDAMGCQEILLQDRRFTLSNHQEQPILAKLDRFLVCNSWSSLLPKSMVTSTSAPVSNHCPLILVAATTITRPAVFRFNNH
jgi:hypothetical protein